MPTVSFAKNKIYKAFTVLSGTNLMQALLKHNLPVASACLGKGVCSKCQVKILKGGENLSLETPSELQLKEKNKIEKTRRISCQTRILGDVIVDTDYW